ncbi:Zn-ribbon domain-containing OB-fold protein [Roseomonas chloroacetimidivorans]|uniref:Zn-ribbon domain-containing OB-fold protein n=1 Tax=Roseomonas chloroacetimidivorans TaxID=1766656 RepID=UPI003C72142F
MTVAVRQAAGRRAYPPRVTAHTRRFWEGLAEGRLETTRCTSCGQFSFPPKPVCPHCWSCTVEWKPLSGRGRLYAATTIHAAPAVFRAEAPYHVAIVDLEEGLRLATRLLDEAIPALDTPVRIVALVYEDGPLFAACAAREG